MTEFVADKEIYERVICGLATEAAGRLWIATADIKDMYASDGFGGMAPFLGRLAQFVDSGIEVRLIHAKEPGQNFREDFDRFPSLWSKMERLLCPRVHFKCVIADGRIAYFGSANMTGAGMGAKSASRRNFENGVISDDPKIVDPLVEQFDSVWRGERCEHCGRKKYCGDCPVD